MSREKAIEMLFEGQGCLYLACIHESQRLYKYGCSANLQQRTAMHKSHFKHPYMYRLEFAWKADRPREAEDTFKCDPIIKELHTEIEVGGIKHREIIHLPDRVNKSTVVAIAEKAAHNTQRTIQHLYVGAGLSNDEKSKEVLLAKEKTKQAKIKAKVRLAELDLRMEELRLTHSKSIKGQRLASVQLRIPPPGVNTRVSPLPHTTSAASDAHHDAEQVEACSNATFMVDTLDLEECMPDVVIEATKGQEGVVTEVPTVDEAIGTTYEEGVPEQPSPGTEVFEQRQTCTELERVTLVLEPFIRDFCKVGSAEKVTSADFYARFSAVTGGNPFCMRIVGIAVHKVGFQGP